MSVIIVSHNHMLRDMLVSTCEACGFETAKTFERLADIQDITGNELLLQHVTRDCTNPAQKLSELRRNRPDLRIIVLSAAALTEQMQTDIGWLVDAIVPDDNSAKTLIGVLTVVQEGFRVIRRPATFAPAPGMAPAPDGADQKLRHDNGLHNSKLQPSPASADPADTPGTGHKTGPHPGLSTRETMILTKLRQGGSNKDIANALDISEGTVKVHLRACFRKIGARNRTQAAIWASEHL